MLLLWFLFAHAETLYAAEAVEAVRWPDVTAVSLRLAPGDEVEVLVRDGGKVRVRRGTDFGWVAESALRPEPPAVEPPPVEGAPPSTEPPPSP